MQITHLCKIAFRLDKLWLQNYQNAVYLGRVKENITTLLPFMIFMID